MYKKVISWLIVGVGLAFLAYGATGVYEYGFYVSGRGSIGQLEGGLAPLFILIGLMAIVYGVVDLKFYGASNNKDDT